MREERKGLNNVPLMHMDYSILSLQASFSELQCDWLVNVQKVSIFYCTKEPASVISKASRTTLHSFSLQYGKNTAA